MFILALDIDDCIYPNNNTYLGRMDDSLDILKMNVKRIQMMIEKYKMQIFITSSWYIILNIEPDGTVSYSNKFFDEVSDKSFYIQEKMAFDIMKPLFDYNVVGLSKGDRYQDIKRLLENGCVVLSFDDMDLSNDKIDVEPVFFKNYKYIKMNGFLTNDKIFEINSFLSKF